VTNKVYADFGGKSTQLIHKLHIVTNTDEPNRQYRFSNQYYNCFYTCNRAYSPIIFPL